MPPRPSLAALLGLAALAPITGRAQDNPQAIYSYFNFAFAGTDQAPCVSGLVLGQYEATGSCVRTGVSGTTYASSSGGALRTRASVTATGPVFSSPGGGTGYLGTAEVSSATSFNETFTFTGIVPASVRFQYELTGSPSITLANRTSGTTDARLNSTVSVLNGQGGSILLQERVYKTTSGLSDDVDTVLSQRSGPITALLQGTPVVQVGTLLQVFATLQNYLGRSSTGTVDADYSHTGRIAYLQAFDASGADISRSVTVSTASGVTYAIGAPVSTVPEPGTWALVGAGLFAVGAAARRSALARRG